MDMKHNCYTFAKLITFNNTDMKKLLLITMLVAVASLFTACDDTNKKMAQDLSGTWEGSTYLGEEEYPADYQFFPDAESNTGKFLEIDYLSLVDEVGDDTYEMPYIAYSGGTYTVKEGKLFLDYDSETAWVWFEDEPVLDYVTAFLEYDREFGEGEWLDYEAEELAEYFINSRTDDLGSAWEEVISEFNTGMTSGYGELKVTPSQFSYSTSDLGTLVFTRADYTIFDEYPF